MSCSGGSLDLFPNNLYNSQFQSTTQIAKTIVPQLLISNKNRNSYFSLRSDQNWNSFAGMEESFEVESSYIQKKNQLIWASLDDPFSNLIPALKSNDDRTAREVDQAAYMCEFWGFPKSPLKLRGKMCTCWNNISLKQSKETNKRRQEWLKLNFGPKTSQRLLELTQMRKQVHPKHGPTKNLSFLSKSKSKCAKFLLLS